MKLTITEKKDNQLLARQEIKGDIEFEGATPSNSEITGEVASQIKAGASLVVMKHIYTHFGTQKADFAAVVYKTAEAKQKTEPVTKHLKKKMEEEKKKAAEEAAKKKAEEEAAKKAEEEKAKTAEEQPAAEEKKEGEQ